MLKAIIFDCWSTLFFKKQPFISALAESLHVEKDDRFQRVVEECCELAPCSDFVTTATTVLERLKIKATSEKISAVVKILSNNWLPRPFPNTIPTIKLLKSKGYQLGIISNAFSPSFSEARTLFNLDSLFDVIITSYETGFLKPDRRIFQLALERLGVKPEEALMVGDNPIDDLEGAAAVGIKGLMLDNKNKHPDYQPRISSIAQIFEWIKAEGNS